MSTPDEVGEEKHGGGVPIFVDLDGTLLRTDLIDECLARWLADGRLFRHWHRLCLGLLAGIPVFKSCLAEGLTFDIAALPVNKPFVDWLTVQKARGRQLHLLSAGDHRLVHEIGTQFGLFDTCQGTQPGLNLKGRSKVRLIRERGIDRFCYAGNSWADMPIWREANERVLVGAPEGIRAQLDPATITYEQKSPEPFIKALVRGMRPHQWVKNLLVFVPILSAHKLDDTASWLASAMVFVAFCLCASGVYLVNDVIDVDADRQHWRKKLRPVAAGYLPIRWALVAHLTLIFAGLSLAFAVNTKAGVVAAVYVALTAAYSLRLKSLIVVDTIILAILYVIRIVAGHAATGITESFWLFMFSGLLFLSLAFLKRSVEIQGLLADGQIHGRGYERSDAPVVMTLGVSAGLMAVLVLGLYLHSPEVEKLYREPRILWGVLPLAAGWVAYVWMAARRGWVADDPVVFAIRDPVSHAVALAAVGLGVLATLWNG